MIRLRLIYLRWQKRQLELVTEAIEALVKL
jgi:hypothetical protein